MSGAAIYRGFGVVPGTRKETIFPKLDPRNWQRDFGWLWNQSFFLPTPAPYFVTPRTALPPLQQGAPPAQAVKKPPSRAEAPPNPPGGNPDPAPAPPPPGTNPFFENVLFGGFRYRNVLKVTPGPDEYCYEQRSCLNTRSPLGLDDGGIDVDNGRASVQQKGDDVHVVITKSVRFTEPAFLADELEDLAHTFVQLGLDIWLHKLVFDS